MILRILQVGKTKDHWLQSGIAEYLKRIKPMARMEIVEVPDCSLSETGSADEVRNKESAASLKRLSAGDYVVLLDEHGQMKSSLEFSVFLTSLSDKRHVVFVTGGVFGVSEAMKKRANHILSLSQMTYTHQMVRLVLAEQIYRALMIQNNRSYHY